MAFSDRTYNRLNSGSTFPPGVKWLLVSNIALFVLNFVSVRFGLYGVFQPFGLVPADVLQQFAVWQLVTYMFLHDPLGFGHILFNMLTLWMFGTDLERQWGTRAFLKYYFLCGVGAAVCVIIANLLFSDTLETRTIGASGAIYGLLMAFGFLYPDRQVMFSFLFPIKAKYFVMILGAIAFLSSLGASGGGISHVAHLGGMLFGYFYLKNNLSKNRVGLDFKSMLEAKWRDYKIQRARKKFEVYMRRRESDRDSHIH
jgi:membrane associated rhomboid family serine protease